jgi:hypothetical protein
LIFSPDFPRTANTQDSHESSAWNGVEKEREKKFSFSVAGNVLMSGELCHLDGGCRLSGAVVNQKKMPHLKIKTLASSLQNCIKLS